MAKHHQKHPKLKKPHEGALGRHEWSITGTTCTDIERLASIIISELGRTFQIAYFDARHHTSDDTDTQNHLGVIEHQAHHQVDFAKKLNPWQLRPLFNESDILLINGNHFTATRQIVVIDQRKEKSLSKKLEQLTQVELLIVKDDIPIYPFLKEVISKDIPIIHMENRASIADFFRQRMKALCPPLHGLALIGGYSQRMGADKGLIKYHHNTPQRDYLFQLLSRHSDNTFYSCREDQIKSLGKPTTCIADKFLGLGPFGGILSAFRSNPKVAWLVAAVDLPLIDDALLEELISARDPSKVATALNHPEKDFPEPLITIWEPKAYPILLSFLAQGNSCPTKVLLNSNTKIIAPNHPEKLENINTKDDWTLLMKKIRDKI